MLLCPNSAISNIPSLSSSISTELGIPSLSVSIKTSTVAKSVDSENRVEFAPEKLVNISVVFTSDCPPVSVSPDWSHALKLIVA